METLLLRSPWQGETHWIHHINIHPSTYTYALFTTTHAAIQMPNYLSVPPDTCMSIPPYSRQSTYPSIIQPAIHTSVPSVHHLPFHLSIYIPTFPPIHLSIYLSLSLSVSLSPICPSIHLPPPTPFLPSLPPCLL